MNIKRSLLSFPLVMPLMNRVWVQVPYEIYLSRVPAGPMNTYLPRWIDERGSLCAETEVKRPGFWITYLLSLTQYSINLSPTPPS